MNVEGVQPTADAVPTLLMETQFGSDLKAYVPDACDPSRASRGNLRATTGENTGNGFYWIAILVCMPPQPARPQPNRWVIAIAGVIMQIALGAVYAWSVFRIPLTKTFGWTISQVTFAFTLAILTLGFASFLGGLWMRRSGPRTVAIAAGILYGGGVFLASFSAGHLYWLYFSYGIIGGIGIGLGYIVPVATLVKWFPDRRGMITGIAVAGFGAGALITAPIASRLIVSVGVLKTFAILGIAYFIAVTIPSFFMKILRPIIVLKVGPPARPNRNNALQGLTISPMRCVPGSGTDCGRCCF